MIITIKAEDIKIGDIIKVAGIDRTIYTVVLGNFVDVFYKDNEGDYSLKTEFSRGDVVEVDRDMVLPTDENSVIVNVRTSDGFFYDYGILRGGRWTLTKEATYTTVPDVLPAAIKDWRPKPS